MPQLTVHKTLLTFIFFFLNQFLTVIHSLQSFTLNVLFSFKYANFLINIKCCFMNVCDLIYINVTLFSSSEYNSYCFIEREFITFKVLLLCSINKLTLLFSKLCTANLHPISYCHKQFHD